jgi:hypothetical protein
MAGDGGRAPDVSEQRSVRYTVECSTCDELDTYGYGEEYLRLGQDHKAEHPDHYVYIKAQWYLAAATPPDPASVLAALLAEQLDAMIAALHDLGWARVAEACQSLRPKAPKEDR